MTSIWSACKARRQTALGLLRAGPHLAEILVLAAPLAATISVVPIRPASVQPQVQAQAQPDPAPCTAPGKGAQ